MNRYKRARMVGGVLVVLALVLGVAVTHMPTHAASIVWRQGICGSRSAPFMESGACMLLGAASPREKRAGRSAREATRRVIERRVKDGLGLAAERVRLVTYAGQWFIEVDLPGLKKNPQSVESVVQRTGQLTIVALGLTPLPPNASTKGYQVLANGKDLIGKDVRVGMDQIGRPAVNVTVKDPGATNIYNYTQGHVGQFMGIAIDGRIYDSPLIQDALSGGAFQITGLILDQANNLAITLKYGALAVPLKIVGVVEQT